MIVCFSFKAKAGTEKEFEGLLNNPEAGLANARAMGATRNTLFLGGGRMVRVLEFPEGAEPADMAELAAKDPKLRAFLEKIAPLIEDGFDADDPASLEAFNRRSSLALAYDVRP
ncbi:MAG: hypothetical protein A3K65_03020 [Euryarchaeota archaeon RBG_16_68_12]|nr:MAG: hypothetical protein A3K65_03020 [Euryarchaeota archaeon RBG_16_68_12]